MSFHPDHRRRFARVRHRAVVAALTAACTLATVLVGAVPGAASEAHAAPADVTDGTAHEDRLAPSITCPLIGPSQFIDSWGASRSGGRRHEGVDMIADRGTPIVAARSGTAEFKQSGLGGNAIWLTTAAGDRYYYAHLDRFEGTSRSVIRGEVIGYVGSTGNADGPHLHFETLPNSVAVNPFTAVFSACVGPATPVTLNASQGVSSGIVTSTVDAGEPIDAGATATHRR